MITFDNNIPTSLPYIPLVNNCQFSVSTSSHIYLVKYTNHRAEVSLPLADSRIGIINESKYALRCIEENKDLLLQSEMGKFYYYGKEFLSLPTLVYLMCNAKFAENNTLIFKFFNTNPTFFAKILTTKIGHTIITNTQINSLQQLYQLGQMYNLEENKFSYSALNNINRTQTNIIQNKMMQYLPNRYKHNRIHAELINVLTSNQEMSSRTYNTLRKLILINDGFEHMFSSQSIAKVLKGI